MAYNYVAENTDMPDQGAQYTERSENERIQLADETNRTFATENTENQRIQTAPRDPDSRLAQQDNS